MRGTSKAAANTLGLYECSSTDQVNVSDAVPTESKEIKISKKGVISGAYTGTLTLADDGYTATISLNGYGTFKGYFLNAVDWARKGGTSAERSTIRFTTLCSDNSASSAGEYFWGNRQ